MCWFEAYMHNFGDFFQYKKSGGTQSAFAKNLITPGKLNEIGWNMGCE